MGRKQILGDRGFAILLLIPAFLLLAGVILLPLIDAVRMSFTVTKHTSLHKHKYVGFRNYARIFTDPTYWEVVKNTFLIVGISVGLSLVTGFALAIALNSVKRGRGALRAPIIAIATVLRVIYTMQNFVIIYMITQGGPGYATETFALYVYETAFNSARLGSTWLIFLLVFVALYLKLVVKEEKFY